MKKSMRKSKKVWRPAANNPQLAGYSNNHKPGLLDLFEAIESTGLTIDETIMTNKHLTALLV
jgi:hypothetical protein